MRRTLTIDDDVLAAAKELAEAQGKTGAVISSLIRKVLMPTSSERRTRNGISLLPIRKDAKIVSTALVRKLNEELD